MRTFTAKEAARDWDKLAEAAQVQPIRVIGDDAADVVVLSMARFDAMCDQRPDEWAAILAEPGSAKTLDDLVSQAREDIAVGRGSSKTPADLSEH